MTQSMDFNKENNMKNNISRIILMLLVLLFVVVVVGCTSTASKISNLPNYQTNTNNNNQHGKLIQPDDVELKWDIKLKGYNIVKPPATLTLSIARYNQPLSDYVYKYQINEDQPWIDVTSQVNAVNIGEYCDIPLTFTSPGKYWITTKIFYDETEWTGLYRTDFVIVTEPEE